VVNVKVSKPAARLCVWEDVLSRLSFGAGGGGGPISALSCLA